jgi:hypothetical protein
MGHGEGTWMLSIPEDRGPEELLNDSACVHHRNTVRDLGDEGKMLEQEAYGRNLVRRLMLTGLNAVFRGNIH